MEFHKFLLVTITNFNDWEKCHELIMNLSQNRSRMELFVLCEKVAG